ncbi:GRIP and coiled-coil domain-containing protein 1-like isoform X1 [Poecile atricapillus]|uniref:GRIP and coiled-coil domain-containing protein 1-like isoform X1 n=2 Tax=Poecile atricapillus TaxID=48891 RepID=UPI002738DE2E|nr:GRIP and coiled-coil domain-containing protein 1-like isoform X1 [Poecile atricapillus]
MFMLSAAHFPSRVCPDLFPCPSQGSFPPHPSLPRFPTMEKFGMNFGGGPSRKELLETIETQKQQLQRFQARLKDVVLAYKSLLKEKEALESSLKVLSVSPEENPAVSPPGERRGEDSDSEEEKPSAAPSRGAEDASGSESGEPCPGDAERRPQQLQAQLATLTAALATLTQEKSRVEASYRAERLQMRRELEEAAGRDAELQEQLAQTRGRLAEQQREREREQGDHGLMLRELQELLRAEREARRAAELQLQQARDASAGSAGAAERAQGHQEQQLSRELEELRRELQGLREENGKADPRIQELQEEMAALKNHFQLQLVQEMKKTAQAEEQLRQRSQREEQRVAELEAQVAQVSELLGTYERTKQRDQATIQRLKDRLLQLDLENKTLAIAASSRSLGEEAVEETTLDVSVLKEKMEKLRKLLQAAAGKGPEPEPEEPREPEEPPEPAEPAPGSGDGDKGTGGHCQQELRQLKEEFERYKVRAQQVLKSKASKDVGLAKELEEAREQLAELRDKQVLLQLAADEAQERQRQELEAKRQELQQLQQLHRQELERCQLQFRERALRLEEEMHKQRDRALAVLAEKERELERLRAPAPPHGTKSSRDGASGDVPGRDSSEILPQELQPCSGSEPTFFLYAEQLARKEVEIAALRKHKHRLEVQLHQLQGRALAEEDKHREEVEALRGEIQKNCRDKSREGANLEYLKNVVYRFLTLPDARGRQQTLTAILAILHFSPEEKLSIAKSSAHGSWWLHGKR